MAIILLDENFYEESQRHINKAYFEVLLNFMKKNMLLNIAIFLPNYNLGSALSERNFMSNIYLQIQKTGLYEIFDSNEVEKCREKIELHGFSIEFINQVDYLHHERGEVIIPFSEIRHDEAIKRVDDYIYIVNQIEKEIESNFEYFIERGYITVVAPTKESPLPNASLCEKFKEFQDSSVVGKTIKERQAIYYQIAKEVILRNGYSINQHVSALNKGVYGSIFSYGNLPILYASVDIEHGAVEIFDKWGKHQDEYTYNNKPQNKQDIEGKHDINV